MIVHSYFLIPQKEPLRIIGGGGFRQVGTGLIIAQYSHTHPPN